MVEPYLRTTPNLRYATSNLKIYGTALRTNKDKLLHSRTFAKAIMLVNSSAGNTLFEGLVIGAQGCTVSCSPIGPQVPGEN
jgi:hypothetical protein